MSEKECIEQMDAIRQEWYEKKLALLNQFAIDNAKFQIGDFIGWGGIIIKIDNIKGVEYFGHPQINYSGVKYKKVKGEILPLKEIKKGCLYNNERLRKY